MICRIEDLKKISSILLTAVDTSDISKITDNLELKVENKVLNLSVTNGEYYVLTKLPIYEDIDFHATVNANIFLKLLTKITTETVEFKIDNNNLIVIGNGEYKIPLIFDRDSLLSLPEINIENITNTFMIESSILKSILLYNSRELNKKNIVSNPVQKLYYIDNEGAITFTSGACVNVFKLEKPIKILLNQKIVNLFKLFDDTNIKFSLGQDQGLNNIIQTKVCFESECLKISAIIPSNDTLIKSVPVKAIRERAFNTYSKSVSINRLEFLQAIDRIMIFYSGLNNFYVNLNFNSDTLELSSINKEIKENIKYITSFGLENDVYKTVIDLNDIKTVLQGYSESHITINFGDNQAFVIIKPNVYSVIPEVRL